MGCLSRSIISTEHHLPIAITWHSGHMAMLYPTPIPYVAAPFDATEQNRPSVPLYPLAPPNDTSLIRLIISRVKEPDTDPLLGLTTKPRAIRRAVVAVVDNHKARQDRTAPINGMKPSQTNLRRRVKWVTWTITLSLLLLVILRQRGFEQLLEARRLETSDDGLPPSRSVFESIPYHIWQTTPTHKISERMQGTSGSWKANNPGHSWSLAVDDEVLSFLRAESAGLRETVDLLLAKGAPTVMIADIWRYAILYHYGGVYADFDTVSKKPIEGWLPPEKPAPELESHRNASQEYMNLEMEDCAIVIGMEAPSHFCQWAFASTPGHPILGRVLDLIVERAKDFPHTESGEHFIHYHTGPAVFTAGIVDALGLTDDLPGQIGWQTNDPDNARQTLVKAWTDPEVRARAKSMRACFLSEDFFRETVVEHQFSSLWQAPADRGYDSWTQDRKVYMEKLRDEAQSPAAGLSRIRI
jgi:hypothetical protein